MLICIFKIRILHASGLVESSQGINSDAFFDMVTIGFCSDVMTKKYNNRFKVSFVQIISAFKSFY